jgi:hypothetical protein
MVFAGIVSVPVIIATVDAKLAPKPSLPGGTPERDPRLSLLERFFESADAPAKAFSRVFLAEADQYNLDWRLLPSISFVESTGGKAAPNNNMFGWDCGRAAFSSMIEGIRTVAYNLGNTDRYKGKNLDEVLMTYNPNPDYSRIVKSVMVRIAPAE